jgi:glycosyltransferase involved in cell wall biosynthesis
LAKVSAFPLSFLYKLEQKRLSKFETRISTWSTVNMFVSPAEAELYRQQGGQGEIVVLPMCTELEVRRLPLDQVPYQGTASGGVEQSDEARLIFVGTLNYYPNIDAVIYFTQQIFPLIREKFPRAVFEIVGRNPPKAVTALGRIDGVRVLGEVPDVRSYLVRADVSVAPLRIARGVQSKVLEAMGMGVPVVATPAAIQGIDVANGQELLTGQTPEEFAACVIKLLNDAELRKTITRKAWNRMKQLYNPEVIGAHLERILSAAQAGKPQAAKSTIANDHEVSAQGR